MIVVGTLPSGFPLLVETFIEDFGSEVPIHLMFGATVAFTLLAGSLLIGYSSSFTRTAASRIHTESALALWYGIVVWVVTYVVVIVLGFAFPPLASLLLFVVQTVGYAVAAIALGSFVLRGPLGDDSAEGNVELEDETVATPANGGFDGIIDGEPGPFLALLVGTIPIALLVVIPLFGQIITILIAGFGIGAVVLEYVEYEEPAAPAVEG